MPTAVLFVHTFEWCGACKELKKNFQSFESHIKSIDPRTEIRMVVHKKWGIMEDQEKYINLGTIVSAPTLVLVPNTQAGPNGDFSTARIFTGKVVVKNGTPSIEMAKHNYKNMGEMFTGIKAWLTTEIKNITSSQVPSNIPSGLPAVNFAASSSTASSATTSPPAQVKPTQESSHRHPNANSRRTRPAQTENDKKCKNFRLVPV